MANITGQGSSGGQWDEYSHPLVSWRSVLAGLMVALFSYVSLLALGLGLGGFAVTADHVTDPGNAGLASGVWVIVTAAISLFLGSYFASRISRFSTAKIGSAQALLITALFFGLLALQLASSLGTAGRAVGSLLGTGANMAGGLVDLAANPQVQDILEGTMEDLQLKSSPEQVTRGLAVRLIRGDTVSARDYLARQAGLTPVEAEMRIDRARGQIQNALSALGQSAARTASAAGWSLFVTMLLGALSAIAGGAVGSRLNFKKPLSQESGGYSSMQAAPV